MANKNGEPDLHRSHRLIRRLGNDDAELAAQLIEGRITLDAAERMVAELDSYRQAISSAKTREDALAAVNSIFDLKDKIGVMSRKNKRPKQKPAAK